MSCCVCLISAGSGSSGEGRTLFLNCQLMYLGWKRFLLMPWQWSVCSNVEKKKKVAFRDFRHHNVSKSFSRDFLTISQEKRKVWIFLQFKVQKLEDLKAAKSKCATGRRLWRILKTIKWSSSELWPNLTFSVTHLHCPITTYWFVRLPAVLFIRPGLGPTLSQEDFILFTLTIWNQEVFFFLDQC